MMYLTAQVVLIIVIYSILLCDCVLYYIYIYNTI